VVAAIIPHESLEGAPSLRISASLEMPDSFLKRSTLLGRAGDREDHESGYGERSDSGDQGRPLVVNSLAGMMIGCCDSVGTFHQKPAPYGYGL